MGVMRGGNIGYVIWILAFGVVSSEGNRWSLESFFGVGDKYMAEQVWTHCWDELMDTAPWETVNDIESLLFTKRSIGRVLRLLPFHIQQTFFDCLRKKELLLHESLKDTSSKNWLIKLLKLLFDGPKPPRRYLVNRLAKDIDKNKSPGYIAPTPGPDFAPGPAVESPNYAPILSYYAPVNSPSPTQQPPVEAPEQTSPSSASKHHKPSRNVQPSKKNDDGEKDMLIAIAVAVGIMLVIVMLLVRCLWGRSNKVDPKDNQPIASINSSDVSGSSLKSASFVNSGNKELNYNNGMIMSSVNNVSGDCVVSLAEASNSKPKPSVPPPRPPPPSPSPPPPPKAVRAPPIPPKGGLGKKQPSPLGPNRQGKSTLDEGDEPHKTKLKPFFWDKVLADPDHSMVWHEIKAGSFVVDEETMESLFGYTTVNKTGNANKKESSSGEPSVQFIQIINPRKAQNLSILLRALNVTTEEVCDALREGTELPLELIQTLLKMAPTTEEELKLRLYTGDISQLGPAERFLKIIVDIPHAFKRLESLLFMSSVQEEIDVAKDSFATLEVACNKLRKSRLFLKLLEAVLKTGNRMNDGTYRGGAQAFKLDTLLKLSDVKGTDGKTSLLHFVVQEIIRSEGIRSVRAAKASQSISSVKSENLVEDSTYYSEEHYCYLGLEVVSGVSNELEDVKKASLIDGEGLTSTISKLGISWKKTQDFLDNELKNTDENSEFCLALGSFLERIEADIKSLLEEEKRTTALVKSTGEYFHGQAVMGDGLCLFVIVRDFLGMLDMTCKEVRDTTMKQLNKSNKDSPTASASPKTQDSSTSSASPKTRFPQSDIRARLFPQIMERRLDDSSSDDDESLSP